VQQRLSEINALPKPVIAYCRSGNRSGMAVYIMKQSGITEAINGGGIEDMKAQSLS
jgi:phage shock protein E